MQINYILTEDEFIDAQKLYRATSLPLFRRILQKSLPWIGAVLLGAWTLRMFWWWPAHYMSQVGPYTLPRFAWDISGFVGIMLVLYGPSQDLAASKQYIEEPGFQCPVTMHFSEENVRVESETINSEVSWNSFTHCVASESLFLLYLSRKRFFIIPKRVFTADQVAEFCQLLQKKVPSITRRTGSTLN